jgi:hypothetical protein
MLLVLNDHLLPGGEQALPAQVASLPPTTSTEAQSALSGADIARAIQSELRRAGCNGGSRTATECDRQRDGVVEIAAFRNAKQSDAYTPHEAKTMKRTSRKPAVRSRSTELNQDRLEAEPSAGSTGR